MFKGLNREIEQLAKDKGMNKQLIIDAVQSAFLQAAKKRFGQDKEIEAHFNETDEEIELFEFRNVVEKIVDPNKDIEFAEARKHDPECQVGDSIGLKMNSEELGRIAAQAAKQVIISKIREAETDIIFEEYKDRKDSLLAGIVRRFEKGNIIIDLGRTEAILPPSEQVPREIFRPGDRIQTYVLDVRKTPRGAEIIVSRASPGLMVKLFTTEVPEIYEGVVKIESAAREPGGRAKIAVSSKDPDVDPVGACVGMKGSRVQAVVQELRGEKIDIVSYEADPARYICNAIAPAEVSRVVLDEKNRRMELVVADDQLSLAIGKKGQNVRLAAKLTGWHVDIHGETKMKEMADKDKKRLTQIEGLNETLSELLYSQGITSPEAIVGNPIEKIVTISGLDKEKVEKLQKAAQEWLVKEPQWLAEQAVIEAQAAQAAKEAAAQAAAAATPVAAENTTPEEGKQE